jgi:hypothetical protein
MRASAITLSSAGRLSRRPCNEESGCPVSSKHLERTLNALRIGRIEPSRRHRINARELGVQRRPAETGRACVDCGAQFRIRWRQRTQAFVQRLEVEHRPADKQRHPSARSDSVDCAQGIVRKPRSGISLGRRDEIDQVMRNACACRRIGFRGADIHAAVHLRGIDADDFHREAFGEGERQRAFSRRGRAHQQHRRNIAHRPRMNNRSRSDKASWYHVGRP